MVTKAGWGWVVVSGLVLAGLSGGGCGCPADPPPEASVASPDQAASEVPEPPSATTDEGNPVPADTDATPDAGAPAPLKVWISTSPAVPQPGQSLELTAHVIGGVPPYSYVWEHGFTADTLFMPGATGAPSLALSVPLDLIVVQAMVEVIDGAGQQTYASYFYQASTCCDDQGTDDGCDDDADANDTDDEGGDDQDDDTESTQDTTQPSVTVEQRADQPDPTNKAIIHFTATFSEDVGGSFTGADVTLGGSANPTTALVTGGPAVFSIAVGGMSRDGPVTAQIPTGAAVDASGNPCQASTSQDNVVSFDGTGPTVTVAQAAGQPDPTNNATIHFTVAFSDAVGGQFTNGDVAVGGSAGAGTALVTGGPAVFNVAVSGMTKPGAVTLFVPAGAAVDALGNPSLASGSLDNTVTFDNAGPSVTVAQAAGQPDPTSDPIINFTASFSEAVGSTFTGSDVILGGTANATTAIVAGGPAAFSITVSGMTNDGTVTVSIPAGAAADAIGNPSPASTSTDNTVTFEQGGPTLASAVSRKTHGSAGDFDIDLSLDQNSTSVECRVDGPTEVILEFTSDIQAADGTADCSEVVLSSGTCLNVAITGGTMTIDLANADAADCLAITLVGIEDPEGHALIGDHDVHVRVLTGDRNADGTVNTDDLSAVTADLFDPLTAASFRSDLNTDGIVNIEDLQVVDDNVSQQVLSCP